MIYSKIKIDRADFIALGLLILRFAFILALCAFLFTGMSSYSSAKKYDQDIEQKLILFKQALALHLQSFDYQAAESITKIFELQEGIDDLVVEDRFGFSVYGGGSKQLEDIYLVDEYSLLNNYLESAFLKFGRSYSLYQSNIENSDSVKLGSLKVVVKTQPLLTIVLDSLMDGLLAFILVLVSGYVITWFYFNNYVAKPVNDVVSTLDKTIKMGEYIKLNYKGSMLLPELMGKFNLLEEKLSSIRQNSALFLKQRNDFAKELKGVFDSVHKKELQYTAEIKSIGKVLHSIDQSMSIFDEKYNLVHSNIGSSSSPCVVCLLSMPTFSVDKVMEKIAQYNVKARILSDHESDEKGYKSLYIIEIEEVDVGVWTVQAIKMDNGTYAVLSNNVTKLTMLEKRLRHAQKAESLGHLTSGVAHEFNNMLAIILGNVELLNIDDKLTKSQKVQLNACIRAGRQAAASIEKLLSYSHESGDMTTSSVINLNSHFDGLRNLLTKTLGPHVNVHLMVSGDLNITADAGGLDSMLVNFAANSRDAIVDKGEFSITANRASMEQLALVNLPCDQEYVVIEVADNGHGMDRQVLSKVFDPYFTTKGVGKGSGLGLSSVYGYVQQLNGDLHCDSIEGEGTRFKIFIPAVNMASPLIGESQISEGIVDIEAININELKDIKIFIVEDEELVGKLLKQILTTYGAKVTLATNLQSAKEKLDLSCRNDPYDVVICDIYLKDGLGTDIFSCDQISEHREALKIVLSGNSGLKNNIKHNADLMLKKPISPEELVKHISQGLGELRSV